jgi:hypothetical protein
VLADIGAKKEAKSSKQNFLGEAATRNFLLSGGGGASPNREGNEL